VEAGRSRVHGLLSIRMVRGRYETSLECRPAVTTSPSSFRVHARQAIEFEFYVPAALWRRKATRTFLNEVYGFVEGATLIGGARGAWHGQSETTHLVRVVIESSGMELSRFMSAIGRAAKRLMEAWHEGGAGQEMFLFTQRVLRVHQVRPRTQRIAPRRRSMKVRTARKRAR
jgi:hypothetical protein